MKLISTTGVEVELEPTLEAIGYWWDNNEAAVDSAALNPKHLIIEELCHSTWIVKYPFYGTDRPAARIGTVDQNPA